MRHRGVVWLIVGVGGLCASYGRDRGYSTGKWVGFGFVAVFLLLVLMAMTFLACAPKFEDGPAMGGTVRVATL